VSFSVWMASDTNNMNLFILQGTILDFLFCNYGKEQFFVIGQLTLERLALFSLGPYSSVQC